MTRMMIGPILLLAATVSPDIRPPMPAPPGIAKYRPTSGVTARATASVRIVAGARFGRDNRGDAVGARRRSVRLVEPGGVAWSAELLEFQ